MRKLLSAATGGGFGWTWLKERAEGRHHACAVNPKDESDSTRVTHACHVCHACKRIHCNGWKISFDVEKLVCFLDTAHLIKLALFFRGSLYQICLPHPNFRIHGGFRSARFGSGLSFGNPGFWTFRPIFGTVDFWNFNFFPTKFWVGFFSRFFSEFTDLPKAKMAHLRISVFVEPPKKIYPFPAKLLEKHPGPW